jgi:hypothetical protein
MTFARMLPQIKPKQLWIGLVEVRPLAGCKVCDKTHGAFVNIVTWASNAYDYGRKVGALVRELRLFVVGIEDAEPVDARREREGFLEESIEDIIFEASGNPNATVYGTFHTYEKVDA